MVENVQLYITQYLLPRYLYSSLTICLAHDIQLHKSMPNRGTPLHACSPFASQTGLAIRFAASHTPIERGGSLQQSFVQCCEVVLRVATPKAGKHFFDIELKQ